MEDMAEVEDKDVDEDVVEVEDKDVDEDVVEVDKEVHMVDKEALVSNLVYFEVEDNYHHMDQKL